MAAHGFDVPLIIHLSVANAHRVFVTEKGKDVEASILRGVVSIVDGMLSLSLLLSFPSS